MRKWVFPITIVLLIWTLSGCGTAPNEEAGNESEGSGTPRSHSEDVELSAFNQMSERLYQLTNEGRYEQARVHLQQMLAQMTQIRFESVTSPEGMAALADTLMSAKRVFNAIRPDTKQAALTAAEIRLAADALNADRQPMWLEHYDGLADAAGSLESAVKDGDRLEAVRALEQVETRYGLVRTALLVDRPVELVEQMDSLLTYMDGLRKKEEISLTGYREPSERIAPLVDELFMKKDVTAYLTEIQRPDPLYWILAIGSAIILVLAMVGWQKFRFERDHVTPHNRGQKMH